MIQEPCGVTDLALDSFQISDNPVGDSGRGGVSRTPVREALLQLEESALIRFHRNRGFISVVTVSEADLAEISSSD